MTISAAIIAKNEEEFIGSCLKSIQDLCDEIVIVDTGSTDRTIEIVQQCDKVKLYHFDWIDDFSAARNESLKYCSGDWIIQIDCDEELDQGAIPFIRAATKDEKINGMQISMLNKTKEGYAIHYPARIFRNGYIHFEGAKHNQPIIAGKTAFIPQIKFIHYGYDLTPEKKAAKDARDEALLLKQIEAEPDSMFHRRNLIRTYRSMKAWDKLIGVAIEAFRYAEEKEIDITPGSWQMIMTDLMNAYAATKQYDSAKIIGEELLEKYPHNADALFDMGSLLMDSEEYKSAIGYYKKYLEKITQQKAYPVQHQLIIDSWGSEWWAYRNIAICYHALNMPQYAVRYFRKSLEADNQRWNVRKDYEIAVTALSTIDPMKILFLVTDEHGHADRLAAAIAECGHVVSCGSVGNSRSFDNSPYNTVHDIATLDELRKTCLGYEIIHTFDANGYLAAYISEYLPQSLVVRHVIDFAAGSENAVTSLVSGTSIRRSAGCIFMKPMELARAMQAYQYNGMNALAFAESMPDDQRIRSLLGFYHILLWSKRRPIEPGLILKNKDIILMELSDPDMATEAYLNGKIQQHAKERIDAVVSLIEGDVLDVGCGDGLIPILAARNGVQATGIDLCEVHIRAAREWALREEQDVQDRLLFLEAEAEQLPFPDDRFDTVVLGEVLEHVIDPDMVMDEAIRVLKPRGKLIVSVPTGYIYDSKHLRFYTLDSLRCQLDRFCHEVSEIIMIGPRILGVGTKGG